jgi:hypothetical protein
MRKRDDKNAEDCEQLFNTVKKQVNSTDALFGSMVSDLASYLVDKAGLNDQGDLTDDKYNT